MCNQKKSNSFSQPFKNILLLLTLVLVGIFFVNCTKQSELIEPHSEKFFDDSMLSYNNYIHSSAPINPSNFQLFANNNRGFIYWYNIAPSNVSVHEILGTEIKVNPEKKNVTALDVVYEPKENGIYNSGQLSADAKKNWGGFFRPLRKDQIESFQKNNVMLKIWIKIEDAPAESFLNIDIGEISEDIIQNSLLDTEDKNFNDLIEPGEDTGIDGMADKNEPNYVVGSDPNKDNYHYSFGNYRFANGLEGNNNSIDFNKFPDSEDLNKNFVLDKTNNFFAYNITLNREKIYTSKIFEAGHNGWILVKIPIDLPDAKVGNPSKMNMNTIRFWISNSEQKVHLKFAEISFIKI